MPTSLAEWPSAWLAAVTIGGASAALAVMLVVNYSDAPLRAAGIKGSSGALEWPFSPATSAAMVQAYRQQDVVTTVWRGLVLDTALFIPSYVTFLLMGCFWAARGLDETWATVWHALGWAAVVAGGLDLVENAGIAVQLLGGSFAAPLTAIVCRTKWLLALTALFSLSLRGAIALFGWACAVVCR